MEGDDAVTTHVMTEIADDLGASWPAAVTLRAAGVAVILGLPTDALPFVIHWGGDIGVQDADSLRELSLHAQPPLATNGVDVPVVVGLLPENSAGWTGTPGLSGHRAGQAWSTRFVPTNVDVVDDASRGGSVRVEAVDLDARLALALVIEMLPSGLLRLSAELRNDGDDVYTVDALQLALPVPTRADVVHDMAGRWGKEKVAQSRRFTVGSHLREGRHGRTGADAAAFLSAGTVDLDFAHGEVWGLHVAFSGNHRVLAERAFSGERLLLGGELLLPVRCPWPRGSPTRRPPSTRATASVWTTSLLASTPTSVRVRRTRALPVRS